MSSKKNLNISFYGISENAAAGTGNRNYFGKFPEDSSDLYQPKGLLFFIAEDSQDESAAKGTKPGAVDIIRREYFSSVSNAAASTLFSAFESAVQQTFTPSPDNLQSPRKYTNCTTLVLSNNFANIVSTGNYGIYRITDEKIERLPGDSINDRMQSGDDTLIPVDTDNYNAKTVLIKILGSSSPVEVDIVQDIPLKEGDAFLVCNEGLTWTNKEWVKMTVLNSPPKDACNILPSLVKESGTAGSITLLVIKVIPSGENGSFLEDFIDRTKLTSINLKFLFWFFLTAAILTAGAVYKNAIFRMFTWSPEEVVYKPVKKIVKTEPNPRQSNLENADSYLKPGALDSVRELYSLIQKRSQMNPGALLGTQLKRKKIIDEGNRLLAEGNIGEAIKYFKKALVDVTDEVELSQKNKQAEKQPDKSESQVDKRIERYKVPVKVPIIEKKKELPSAEIKNIAKTETPKMPFDLSEWNFSGLSDKDYRINENEIKFLGSNRIKELISQNSMKDIDISFVLKFDNVPTGARAGIIFGYNISGNNDDSRYFLFTTDDNGTFLLSNVVNGKEELLKSFKSPQGSDEQSGEYRIKIKSLGPWVILYIGDKLLGSWYGENFIEGKIGLFSSADSYTEFSSFKIGSAFESYK